MRADKALAEKMKGIRLLLLDVDGVLTDGRIIYDDDGRETKFFDVRDGHGLKLLMRSGVEVGIITSRDSRVVAHRAQNLGIALLYQGRLDKLGALEEILEKKDYAPGEVAYVGDDTVDLPVLKRVGLSVAVADAIDEVREMADYVTEKTGGRGAVREVCEMILRAQGKWEGIIAHYMR